VNQTSSDMFDQIAAFLRRVPKSGWFVLGAVAGFVVFSLLLSLSWYFALTQTFGVPPLSFAGAMGLTYMLCSGVGIVWALKEAS
jgi:hypothetical protein